MTTSDPLLDAVRALAARVAGPGRVPPGAGPATRLGEDCWLDSVELLDLLVACEHEFGIAFDDTRDLDAGSLETLGTLTHLIRSKLRASGEDR